MSDASSTLSSDGEEQPASLAPEARPDHAAAGQSASGAATSRHTKDLNGGKPPHPPLNRVSMPGALPIAAAQDPDMSASPRAALHAGAASFPNHPTLLATARPPALRRLSNTEGIALQQAQQLLAGGLHGRGAVTLDDEALAHSLASSPRYASFTSTAAGDRQRRLVCWALACRQAGAADGRQGGCPSQGLTAGLPCRHTAPTRHSHAHQPCSGLPPRHAASITHCTLTSTMPLPWRAVHAHPQQASPPPPQANQAPPATAPSQRPHLAHPHPPSPHCCTLHYTPQQQSPQPPQAGLVPLRPAAAALVPAALAPPPPAPRPSLLGARCARRACLAV